MSPGNPTMPAGAVQGPAEHAAEVARMSPPGGMGGGMGGGGGRGGGRGLGPGMGRGGQQWTGERASRGSRGRNLRALLELLRPYRLRAAGMLVGAAARHRRLARTAAAGQARDRTRDRTPRHESPRAGRDRVPLLGAVGVADDLRPDLPRRLGRTAHARRSAHPHLHPPAEPADRLLRQPPGGRPDLAHDQRRRGAGKPRHRLGRDALPVGAHADRRDRRAALPRPEARAADVLHRALRRRPLDLVPARLRRRLPAHARDDRLAHGLPAGDALRASASCAASGRSPSTKRASPSSTRTTRRPTWSRCDSTPPTSRRSKCSPGSRSR